MQETCAKQFLNVKGWSLFLLKRSTLRQAQGYFFKPLMKVCLEKNATM